MNNINAWINGRWTIPALSGLLILASFTASKGYGAATAGEVGQHHLAEHAARHAVPRSEPGGVQALLARDLQPFHQGFQARLIWIPEKQYRPY